MDAAEQRPLLATENRSRGLNARPANVSQRGYYLLLSSTVVGLIALCLVQTFFGGGDIAQPPAIHPAVYLAQDDAYVHTVATRLSQLIRFQTVSSIDGTVNVTAMSAMHTYLRDTYPLLHRTLTREVVAKYSLLYKWEGTSDARPPVMMLAHLDVVPVEASSKKAWRHAAFSGDIDKDQVVWGRGALDNKGNVVMLMESVEKLLESGFRPSRTIYFGFGHDEEVGGQAGAQHIAELLESRNIHVDFLLDEGLPMTHHIVPGFDKYRLGLIGTAEKGYGMYDITVTSGGGHASMPPAVQPVGALAAAITKVLSTPPQTFTQTHFKQMGAYLNQYRGWLERVALRNGWLFGGMIEKQLLSSPRTASIVTTTYAFTLINGGIAENVLPGNVTTTINSRIVPGETVQSVLARLQELVSKATADAAAHNMHVTVSVHAGTSIDPSPISPSGTDPYFTLLASVMRGVLSERIAAAREAPFDDALVAPCLMMANTDTRHFWKVAKRIYRTSFFLVADEERLAGVHGVNERVDAYSIARGAGGLVELWRRV
ncbi:Gly-Xaa carboxypeptidase [Sorochytrium milnesiophthora]